MMRSTGRSRLNSRRALEALRNGVPNSDAVAVLGCNQPVVEREFKAMLDRVADDGEGPDSGVGHVGCRGFWNR